MIKKETESLCRINSIDETMSNMQSTFMPLILFFARDRNSQFFNTHFHEYPR